MIEAGDERRLLVLQKKLSRLKLLGIDELGFVPLSKTGAELLFEVFSQRYETGSVLVTTNLPFDEWTEVLGSERLTGALLDRLTHHVHILRDDRPELPPKAEPAGHNTASLSAALPTPSSLLAHTRHHFPLLPSWTPCPGYLRVPSSLDSYARVVHLYSATCPDFSPPLTKLGFRQFKSHLGRVYLSLDLATVSDSP